MLAEPALQVEDGLDRAAQETEVDLYIVGRSKELIIRSGFNIYPPDVEAVINEHPAVTLTAVVGRQVGIEGTVRRPAWFELKAGEGLHELLSFAGGLQAGAAIARLQIDRIVPPEERRPGVDRVLVDVDLRDVLGNRRAVALHDHDRLYVFPVDAERRNRLSITGGVRRPGMLEWREGMTLWQAIERAPCVCSPSPSPSPPPDARPRRSCRPLSTRRR